MAKIMCEKLLKDCNSVASLGVGKGILEWHIKQINTSLKVDCADYTVNSINQLKKVFSLGDDFFVFDMLKDDWKSLNGYDCVILYRMSTEFDKKTWEIIFKKMYAAKINKIIFVPTGLDSVC